MSNFKDTVYSILLGEDVIPPATPPRRGIGDDTDRREGRLPAKEPAPKGYTQEEWDKITDKYDEDMKRIDQNEKEEAQAKTPQGIKDAADAAAAEALAAGKAAAAKMPAAMDNRRHEEAVGMVASGEATSMRDARNRMGVRDQVAAERARMAKNPVREVGIASPSDQIGGAGTQYGNSPNRAPETEAEIQYRTGTSAPMADNNPTTGKPILFTARNKRNPTQKQIEGDTTPPLLRRPDEPFDTTPPLLRRPDEPFDTTPPLLRRPDEPFDTTPPLLRRPDEPFEMQNDTTPGSEPGGWEGESQAMADLHNTPAWQKMWAAGQDPITRKNMEASQKRQDKGNTAIQTARDNGDSTLSGLEQKSRDTRLPSEGATTQNRRDHIDAIRAAEYEKGRLRRQANERYSYNKSLTFFAEQLKRKYIEEEVVNPENQPMTKSEISHRDKIRHKSPAKDARIVKSADKTKENAAYRLATYITMRGRKGKKKENK